MNRDRPATQIMAAPTTLLRCLNPKCRAIEINHYRPLESSILNQAVVEPCFHKVVGVWLGESLIYLLRPGNMPPGVRKAGSLNDRAKRILQQMLEQSIQAVELRHQDLSRRPAIEWEAKDGAPECLIIFAPKPPEDPDAVVITLPRKTG